MSRLAEYWQRTRRIRRFVKCRHVEANIVWSRRTGRVWQQEMKCCNCGAAWIRYIDAISNEIERGFSGNEQGTVSHG